MNKNPGQPVQLILRTTSRCNFNCTFCSAHKLQGEMTKQDAIQYIKDYMPVQSLIFEGGDPLCRSPDFYWDIVNTINNEKLQVQRIGITTNLWDFYKRPEKWVELFKLENVDVCTSFQYGNKRMIGNKVYTESMFLEVYDLFKTMVGKPLPFIAVIDEDNQESVLKTAELAKTLNTTCKINAAFKAGLQTHQYSWPDMLEAYRLLIETKLYEYEDNSFTLVENYLKRGQSFNCPFVRNCNKGIRCIDPRGSISTCSIENSWINDRSPLNSNNERDITKDPRGFVVKPQCLTCEYFDWCNQCRINVMQAKTDVKFCEKMRTVIPKLIETIENI